jgi:hypothetical protein
MPYNHEAIDPRSGLVTRATSTAAKAFENETDELGAPITGFDVRTGTATYGAPRFNEMALHAEMVESGLILGTITSTLATGIHGKPDDSTSDAQHNADLIKDRANESKCIVDTGHAWRKNEKGGYLCEGEHCPGLWTPAAFECQTCAHALCESCMRISAIESMKMKAKVERSKKPEFGNGNPDEAKGERRDH